MADHVERAVLLLHCMRLCRQVFGGASSSMCSVQQVTYGHSVGSALCASGVLGLLAAVLAFKACMPTVCSTCPAASAQAEVFCMTTMAETPPRPVDPTESKHYILSMYSGRQILSDPYTGFAMSACRL